MATYFPSSNDQRDEGQMFCLRENLPSTYSEATVLPGNMMVSLNYSSSSGSYADVLSVNTQQQNSCIDISPIGVSGSTLLQQDIAPSLGGSRVVEHDFGTWRDNRNEMLFMPPMGGATGMLQSGQSLQGQGLSLSVRTEIPSGIQISPIQCTNPDTGFSSFLGLNASISGEGGGSSSESFRNNENSHSKQARNAEYMPAAFLGSNPESMKPHISPYGTLIAARTIPNSKYLKAAQQLLDEVVNVRKALKDHGSEKESMKDSKENDGGTKSGSSVPLATGESLNPQESTNISPTELSAAEKQELQNKLTKLLAMLDEVDQRYRQYYHQMQIVVSSFDVIAGSGAAKPYTALAVQTISRHFRCLRDAVNGQIQAKRRSLGEQDSSANSNGIAISRLRYVDQQLRQPRAFQQLGITQQHAWRPQRGLPESSVSILRAWLFEHFLHPYPKDSDKIMLARQTGLKRSQVSNWFINARVRLWKPMVEEMYKEEIGDAETDSNSSSETANKNTKGDRKASEDQGEDIKQTATSTATEQHCSGQDFESKSKHVSDTETVGPRNSSGFQNVIHRKTEAEYGLGKPSGDQRPAADTSRFFPDTIFQSKRGSDRFMEAAAAAYHMSQLGNFGNVGDVSLTLGLQHCEGGGLPMSVERPHSFVGMRGNDIYNSVASMQPETTDFDCMDSGNRQHGFGPSHPLHDFVA